MRAAVSYFYPRYLSVLSCGVLKTLLSDKVTWNRCTCINCNYNRLQMAGFQKVKLYLIPIIIFILSFVDSNDWLFVSPISENRKPKINLVDICDSWVIAFKCDPFYSSNEINNLRNLLIWQRNISFITFICFTHALNDRNWKKMTENDRNISSCWQKLSFRSNIHPIPKWLSI